MSSCSPARSAWSCGQRRAVMAACPGWITTEFFDHAVTDDTICYYNRYYGPEAVVKKALRDMKRGKDRPCSASRAHAGKAREAPACPAW